MASDRNSEYIQELAKRNAAWQELLRHTARLTVTLERVSAKLSPEPDTEEGDHVGGP